MQSTELPAPSLALHNRDRNNEQGRDVNKHHKYTVSTQLSLMLGEGSHQSKRVKAAIDPNESPQHLPISDLDEGHKGNRKLSVWGEDLKIKCLNLIIFVKNYMYEFVIRSVPKSEVLGVVQFSQRK